VHGRRVRVVGRGGAGREGKQFSQHRQRGVGLERRRRLVAFPSSLPRGKRGQVHKDVRVQEGGARLGVGGAGRRAERRAKRGAQVRHGLAARPHASRHRRAQHRFRAVGDKGARGGAAGGGGHDGVKEGAVGQRGERAQQDAGRDEVFAPPHDDRKLRPAVLQVVRPNDGRRLVGPNAPHGHGEVGKPGPAPRVGRAPHPGRHVPPRLHEQAQHALDAVADEVAARFRGFLARGDERGAVERAERARARRDHDGQPAQLFWQALHGAVAGGRAKVGGQGGLVGGALGREEREGWAGRLSISCADSESLPSRRPRPRPPPHSAHRFAAVARHEPATAVVALRRADGRALEPEAVHDARGRVLIL